MVVSSNKIGAFGDIGALSGITSGKQQVYKRPRADSAKVEVEAIIPPAKT